MHTESAPSESGFVQSPLFVPGLVMVALIGTLTFHAGLLLSGSYQGTYDAYVHIFFADHYARSWWNLWEPRWYTGFTVVSYPPLTHQLIGLLTKVTSLPTGFVLVMLVSTLVTTLGVYRFSRLWVAPRPAAYAALLTVFSSSIAETVHVFGQLPTMFVIGVMLNALPYVWKWVEHGGLKDLMRGCALLMVAAAGHHVTTLFGMVFFSGPILATVLLEKFRTPYPDEIDIPLTPVRFRTIRALVIRRVRRTLPALVRCGIFGVLLIMILVITVLPYWLWSRSDPITQITIPHASRDSFIQNPAAGLMFFVIPWGVLFLALPYALYKGFGTRNWILAGSLVGMAILGTGGTTPLPAFLLRGAFYILTLDRFTFWATIVILPFAGLFAESLLHGRLGTWIAAKVGNRFRMTFIAMLGMSLIAFALFTANLTQYRKFQPAPVDMQPIVEFLAKDNHDKWRYLTLGFGDQMAWLSAQTPALNVEGNYHSARRLPEMTSTPVERLDGAKFTAIPGLGSLQQFLTTPQRYNLKYVFVNDAFYEPLLFFSGWRLLGRLENDVRVWERADVPPLPAAIPAQVYPAWQRLMWGTLPVGSLFVTGFTFALTSRPSLRRIRRLVPRHVSQVLSKWLHGMRTHRRLTLIRAMIVEPQNRSPLPASEDWQFWRAVLRRLFPRLNLEPLARRALFGALLMILVIVAAVGAFVLGRRGAQLPESVVLAYYDAIDFKRFAESYDYLATNLTRQEYLRWLSLRGGLLASFAKLENLHMTITEAEDSTVAEVKADWLTALGTRTSEAHYDMVKVGGVWKLRLETPVPPLPRETLFSAHEAAFYLDLPLTSLDQTALARGVFDRTLLGVSHAGVVYNPDAAISFTPESYDAGRVKGRFSGLISVVGYVTNLDSTPSDVTITAILRDKDGNRLAETNVMDGMLHQLLPQETTPFRADFSGADAAQIFDFAQIVAAELIVRGVPAAYHLDRPLVVMAQGVLYNAGTRAVDVPHLLVAYRDDAGELRWIDSIYGELAISPGDTGTFSLPELPANLERWPVAITITGPRIAEVPADMQNATPAVTVHGYSR